MKKILLLCGLLATLSYSWQADSISQYGFIFYFDKNYTIDTFANGDYWVLGEGVSDTVKIDSMYPSFNGLINGWEVNPVCDSTYSTGGYKLGGNQGFSCRCSTYSKNTFDASLVPALPYIAHGGESIVKCTTSVRSISGSCLKKCAVITILSDIPIDSGHSIFRPAYVSTNKTLHSIDSIHYNLLPKLQTVGGAITLDSVVNGFKMVQIDHKLSDLAQVMHPIVNMGDYYGPRLATKNGDAILALCLNNTNLQKKSALIRVLQAGLDKYYMLKNQTKLVAGGGHRNEWSLLLTFTATVLNDTAMMNFLKTNYKLWQWEKDYLYLNKDSIVLYGQTGSTEEDYWNYIVHLNTNRSIRDPYKLGDGGRPDNTYLSLMAPAWVANGLVLKLIPQIKKTYNFDSLFQFSKRWMEVGQKHDTICDTCAPAYGTWVGPGAKNGTIGSSADITPALASYGASDLWPIDTITHDTLKLSKTGYGVTYGPNGSGGCIKGSGRFPLFHGYEKKFLVTAFTDSMWTKYSNYSIQNKTISITIR